MNQAVDIPLLPAQRGFISDAISGRTPHVCYRGGLGSGKTFIGVMAVIVLAMSHAGSEWVIGARSYPQLRDAVIPMFHRVMTENFPAVDYAYHRTDKTVTMGNGAVVMFRSADASISVKSTNPDGILFDEASDWRRDDLLTFYGRARSTRAGEPRRLFTYNPGSGEFADMVANWTASGSGVEYVAPTTENVFLPDGYAASLIETYGGPDSALVRRMVSGENVRFDGLVYPMFDRAVHVIPAASFKVQPGMERVEAIDFGYHNNFVYLMLAKNGEQWTLIHEWVRSGVLLKDHAEAIKAARAAMPYTGPGGWRAILADHDSQDRAELHAMGINTMAADKAVVPGIRDLTAMLAVRGNGKTSLQIVDTCRETIREFGIYEWAKNGEEPVKKNDHCMDAIRYAARHIVTSAGGFTMVVGSPRNMAVPRRGGVVI